MIRLFLYIRNLINIHADMNRQGSFKANISQQFNSCHRFEGGQRYKVTKFLNTDLDMAACL